MIADTERLLLKVFHDYYVRNLSQNDIAVRHRISRKKVQRLLDKGRDENLVEVKIRFPSRMHGELESALEDKYNLLEALVSDVDPDDPENRPMMIRNASDMAADYFLRVMSNGMTVSITWSDHVAQMLEEASRKIGSVRDKPRNVQFVLTLGAMFGSDPDIQTLEATRRLSSTIGGEIHIMAAPSVAVTSDARQALLAEPQIAEAIEMARCADAAYFGIGSIEGESRQLPMLQKLMPGMIKKLTSLGAVGDINGIFFDANGEAIKSELDEHMMGLSIQGIKDLPLSVAIATGRKKRDAIRAILTGGVVRVLVTDVETARWLIEK